jgi:hypothetical protein
MKAKLSADKKLLTAGGRNYVLVPNRAPRCASCAFFRSPARPADVVRHKL